MSEIDKYKSIPKNVASENDLDYSFLRKAGLEYIEQISGNLWTDYNEHDPGITILEMLCYAITDLGSRIEMPIENLLSPQDGTAQTIEEQFFKASDILTSKPVNGADYRKLFIDIEGVKNCWLKKYVKKVYVDCKHDKLSYNPDDFASVNENMKRDFELQGLYSVIVDCDDENISDADFNKLKKAITKKYQANRNLCEDLADISKVETHPISVCANIDVEPFADEELIHAKIIRAIDNYFSPNIHFYSLKQMFEKGYTSDEIFEGPVLENGFIDPAELEATTLRTEVRLSDIMHIIMEIEGVKFIKEISITDCKNPDDDADEWLICIEEGKKPVRCKDSAYSYFKGVLPLNINKKKVQKYLDEMEAAEKEEQKLAKVDKEIKVPSGAYLNTNETTTIQNDFPDTYGITQVGIVTKETTERKSQAKQLKAYLLFFDQVLASYFAHLGKVKDLLSVDNQLKKTYFTQVVEDIRGINEIFPDYSNKTPEELTKKLLSGLDDNVSRKNILLDHLIARFAERFSDYAFLMKELYGEYANKAILLSKEKFLKDYNITSSQRGLAFNYFKQSASNLWNTDNVAGVQKRIARLAGMKNFKRRNLSDSFVEIYDLLDSDGNKVYRWRVRDIDNNIILSATTDYPTPNYAENELYLVILKIIETSQDTIDAAFESPILDNMEIGNFYVRISDMGKYSFDVINKEEPDYSTDYIIARQYLYFSTPETFKKSMVDLIDFFIEVFTEEGMFLIEHILLRPDITQNSVPLEQFMPICTENCESCEPIDPYSYRITVVLPGWTYRFENPDFRTFMEELIRKEIPAHVLARICWIGYRKNDVKDDENQMLIFEKAYKQFLLSKTNLGQGQNETKLKDFIKILTELNSIYPEGRLIDCDNDEDVLEGRIILGRTNIGNI